MVKALYRVQTIHNPVLRGKPLLLLPEGLLVRWPDRVPMPGIGDWFMGTAVTVPPQVHETVLALLFGSSALVRCDAAKRLARNKEHRKRILSRVYSRPYVQQMLASVERIEPDVREQLEAEGESVSIRRLTRAATASALSPSVQGAENQRVSPSKKRVISAG